MADDLGGLIAELPVVQQARFFSAVSLAFLPAVRRWGSAYRSDRRIEQQLQAAADACFADTSPDPEDVAELATIFARENEGPQDGIEAEHRDFTAALDAWICGDIALRLLLDDSDAADGAWYVLEPRYHATSERLFGVVDVGSTEEVPGETTALGDPELAAAVSAARTAAARLGDTKAPASLSRDRLVEVLAPICP